MNSTVPPESKSRRRLGWWIALGLGLFLIPPVAIGVGVLSMLQLDHNAAVLKREVVAASDAQWHTKVQMSVGWVTLSALRAGLRFVHHEHMEEARLALAAVRSASVGVYETNERHPGLARGQLFAETDRMMTKRGWSRLVGVADGDQTVLVYASDDIGSDNRIDLCVTVLDGREMVVVSTRVDAGAVTKLVEQQTAAHGGFKKHLKLAGF